MMSGEVSHEPTNGTGPKVDEEKTQAEPEIQAVPIIDLLRDPVAIKALKEAGNELLTTYGKLARQQAFYSLGRLLLGFLLLAGITAIAAYLTYAGKMDSGGLTFLLGTIVGTLIAFLYKTEGKTS